MHQGQPGKEAASNKKEVFGGEKKGLEILPELRPTQHPRTAFSATTASAGPAAAGPLGNEFKKMREAALFPC